MPMDQKALNNRANQLNPNNPAYHSSRGTTGTSIGGGGGSSTTSPRSSYTPNPDNNNTTDFGPWLQLAGIVFNFASEVVKAYNNGSANNNNNANNNDADNNDRDNRDNRND